MLSDAVVLAGATKQKDRAKQLLEQNTIMETLEKYGEPILVGSYVLDVMVDPDIDIIVQTPTPRESSLAALHDFLEQRGFQKFEYGDFQKHKRENRPESFIVNLRKVVDGEMWEIEIWFFTSSKKEQEATQNVQAALTPETKLEILKQKHARDSKHKKSSMSIYKEVLGLE